jgi:hypothetical protein
MDFEAFKKLLQKMITINNDHKINEKLIKIMNDTYDDNFYNKIYFDYDEKDFLDGIEHFMTTFKTDDYSFKNVNLILNNLVKQFKTPKYKKIIRDDFKSLKDKIKIDNEREDFNKKDKNLKKKQFKELVNDFKNGDNADDNVGVNEMIMNHTGITNLKDDKIKKKKTKF